jgi:hypothetical protein
LTKLFASRRAGECARIFCEHRAIVARTLGLLVENGGVRLVARMAAKVAVSTAKGNEGAKGDLPPHQAAAADQGKLDLATPLKVSHDVLQSEAMKALAARPLIIKTDGGDVEISVSGLADSFFGEPKDCERPIMRERSLFCGQPETGRCGMACSTFRNKFRR